MRVAAEIGRAVVAGTVGCEQVSNLVEGTTYSRCAAGMGDSPVADRGSDAHH